MDIWAQWILRGRFGGDPAVEEGYRRALYPIRDRLLRNARLGRDHILLDVGCGDGLIAFGALAKEESCSVIFSDISADLLDRCRMVAEETGLTGRCRFLEASAEDLSAIDTATLDCVTTRSVLIYVDNRDRAFREFFRVLKPGGWISLFEPINAYFPPRPDELFFGFDIGPVADLAQKVAGEMRRHRPSHENDPMLNFTERDLVDIAEKVGFEHIHLNLKVEVEKRPGFLSWEVFCATPPNPRVSSPGDAMQNALTPEELERFVAHLRPLVESGRRVRRLATAYLSAQKP